LKSSGRRLNRAGARLALAWPPDEAWTIREHDRDGVCLSVCLIEADTETQGQTRIAVRSGLVFQEAADL
jgi:hypothetical protein